MSRLSATTVERVQLLGRDAVISVAQAAILLPGGDAEAAHWLRSVPGLVQTIGATEVVVWGAVADAMQRRDHATPPPARGDLPPPDPDV